MTMQEALMTGLSTTVVGLSIVFAVLIILMLVLKIFEKIFYKPDTDKSEKSVEVKSVQQPINTADVNSDEDEEELIAVLTAAVAAALNTSTYNLKIKSYRRLNQNSPAWNKAGVRETIENRLN